MATGLAESGVHGVAPVGEEARRSSWAEALRRCVCARRATLVVAGKPLAVVVGVRL